MTKFLSVLLVAFGLQMGAFAQENSPYSRYGLGDLAPNHNIFSRAMGGISAAVIDNQGTVTSKLNQSINFTNPASLANLSSPTSWFSRTILDAALETDFRTLKQTNPAEKFKSANIYVPYLQIGFPTSTKKMLKKNIHWGTSFGIKPVTKINYLIEKNERLPGIDSLHTLYNGNGGVNLAFIGSGVKIKNVSVGLSVGYLFGSKDYGTSLKFINDTTYYYSSNSATKTTFGGFYLGGGLHYEIFLHNPRPNMPERILRFGLYGNIKSNLNASSDIIRETVFDNPSGGLARIDSVFEAKGLSGKIVFPAMGGIGFAYESAQWMYGVDLEYGNWDSYRYYGQTDDVQNSWMIRAGVQYFPAKSNSNKQPSKKYTNNIKYRAGLYYGSDYIKVDASRPDYGFTLGTGMPLTPIKRMSPFGDIIFLNTALEIGRRGNNQTNLQENIVRFSVGFSMTGLWFQKPKYN